ncbi:MAG: serine O-acetyltransferase [Alphaproteobacteria bacterium]|nr:serine O-acetyltransferase [Alphaproteobacteria bacterium]
MSAPSEEIWKSIQKAATRAASEEPFLATIYSLAALRGDSLAVGLCEVLAHHCANNTIKTPEIRGLIASIYKESPDIVESAAIDLMAVVERDPAATNPLVPFLYFKGFHALQLHRVAYFLWTNGRKNLALYLQNRSCIIYSVDIHPAAQIGKGIMFDHANGIVIGETAVVEDNVSILHEVTLGGSGKERGDRHPKIRQGVMIGAGAKILGNIEVGEGACVAAGSVVVKSVPPHVTVAGVPAKIIGKPLSEKPYAAMDQVWTDAD